MPRSGLFGASPAFQPLVPSTAVSRGFGTLHPSPSFDEQQGWNTPEKRPRAPWAPSLRSGRGRRGRRDVPPAFRPPGRFGVPTPKGHRPENTQPFAELGGSQRKVHTTYSNIRSNIRSNFPVRSCVSLKETTPRLCPIVFNSYFFTNTAETQELQVRRRSSKVMKLKILDIKNHIGHHWCRTMAKKPL